MPAWRLGRFIGSLLVLAGLAVGGFAASVGTVGLLERSTVTASETSGEGLQPAPAVAFHTFGFEWN
ncbi:hypothetical protein [Plantactinospora soyae]|uniref:Uncharacterized protein n=1 Tax=Plantactinospora soyae TaxID=1544732 RepID=A0A927M474_9ACTN|nr:hypothetical protein [Plantactinospora soyae]MBE1485183.1 hypothetical protein [Plantactinospora soyae]